MMAYNPYDNGNRMRPGIVAGSAGKVQRPALYENPAGPTRRGQSLPWQEREKLHQAANEILESREKNGIWA